MSLLKLKAFFVYIVVYAGLINSCGTSDMKNRGIVARIGDVDSITFEELNYEIAKQRIVRSGEPFFLDKQRILSDLIKLKIIGHYVRQSQHNSPISNSEIEGTVWTHVRAGVNQVLLEKKFIDSAAVERYLALSDEVLSLQSILLYFDSNAPDSAGKSPLRVKRRVDSIYAVCTSENFNELARKFSEYVVQGVRNTSHPVKIPYRDMSFIMENAIFNVPSGKPSKPISLADGYGIFRLNSDFDDKVQNKSKLSSAKFQKAKANLIGKIKKDDASLFVETANSSINEKWNKSEIRIDEKLISEELKNYKVSITSKLEPSFATVAWVNSKPVCTFSRILDKFLRDRSFDAVTDSALVFITREEVKRYLYKNIYITEFGVDEEYFNYLSKNVELDKLKRRLEKSIDDSLANKMTDDILKKYYEVHIDNFANHVDISFSEIKCVTLEMAKIAMSLSDEGIVFEQIPEVMIKKNPRWTGKVKWILNANLSDRPQCIRDRKLIFGEINKTSPVFENEDGTYSIVIVRRRNKETTYPSYADAGRAAFGMYKAEMREKITQSIISEVIQKNPVYVYMSQMYINE